MTESSQRSPPPLSETDRDRQLITRFRQGDETAFAQLYELYFGRVCASLRRYTSDTQAAEDAAQNAFLKARAALRRDDRDIHFRPWLEVIARNTLRSAYRRAKREEAWPQTEEGEELEVDTGRGTGSVSWGDPQAAIEQQETHDLIWSAAAALSEDRFVALYLTYIVGYGGEEVAEALGKESDSIRQFLKKCRIGLGEAGYAQLAKGALRSLPCAELRLIVEMMPSEEPLDEAGQKRISRHVRACPICLEHLNRIPVTDLFAPLSKRLPSQARLGLAASYSGQRVAEGAAFRSRLLHPRVLVPVASAGNWG